MQPLQTLYLRAFVWVTALPGSEIDHIIVVRVFMFGCLVVTALSIAGIVSSLSTRTTGLICAACYLSAGLILHHGTAFRTDIMTAALLSLALWIIAASSLSWKSIASMGFLVGIAGMITIKSVLWAPAFVGLGLIRWHTEGWKPALFIRFIFAALAAGLTFATVYFFHSRGVASDPDASASALIGNASTRMFTFPYLEKLPVILTAVLTALPLAAFIILLPILLIRSANDIAAKAGILGLWAVALVPLFYVNSYPYFYAFILPPVAVSIYLAVEAAQTRYSVFALAIVMAVNGVANWALDERGILHNQRLVLETVRQNLPGPVTYFDCCASIGSWPSGNGFRTAWGVDQYLAATRPAFRDRMLQEPVPLLIAGGWSQQVFQDSGPTDKFLSEDVEALRNTYIPFWGPIHLAGIELRPLEERKWEALVPGPYTVEGSVAIDGAVYADGDTISIDRGTWELQETNGAQARLVWGENILKPETPAPTKLWTSWIE